MSLEEFRRLSYSTSDGILVLGAKINKSHTVARLYLTDLTNSTRVFIDLENRKLLEPSDIKVNEQDLLVLCKLIKNEQLSFMEKVKMSILEG